MDDQEIDFDKILEGAKYMSNDLFEKYPDIVGPMNELFKTMIKALENTLLSNKEIRKKYISLNKKYTDLLKEHEELEKDYDFIYNKYDRNKKLLQVYKDSEDDDDYDEDDY